MLRLSLLLALSALPGVLSQCQSAAPLKYSGKVAQGLSAQTIYSGLTKPRTIRFDDTANLLVLDAGFGVIALTHNKDGCSGWNKKVLIENKNFTHGLEVAGNRLWVSTWTEVLEYKYDSVAVSISGSPKTLLNSVGGSLVAPNPRTHTIVYQPLVGSPPGFLLVHAGAEEDVQASAINPDNGDAQIRRFPTNGTVPDGGFDWIAGELVAYGLRNAVGVTVDDKNMMWALDGGADNVVWDGHDVTMNNPAEELNAVNLNNVTGAFYGYPNCSTVWNMTEFNGPATGTQFATNPSFSDPYCKNPNNVVAPILTLESHSSPLDIKFYTGVASNDKSAAINTAWVSSAFVSMHGSASRKPVRGFGIVRVPWDTTRNTPAARVDAQNGYDYIIQAANLDKCPGECIRPVGMAFDNAGRLFAASDTTGEIFVVEAAGKSNAAAKAVGLSMSTLSVILGAGIFTFLFA